MNILLLYLLFIVGSIVRCGIPFEQADLHTAINKKNVPEAIENHILDVLGISEPPSTFTTQHEIDGRVPKFMLQLYNDIQYYDDHGSYSSNIQYDTYELKSLLSADRIVSVVPVEKQFSDDIYSLNFLLEDLRMGKNERLEFAKLYVFFADDTGNGKATVIQKSNDLFEDVPTISRTSADGMLSFNVSQLVDKWIARAEEPQLHLRVTSDSSKASRRLPDDVFLVAAFDQESNTANGRPRSRRAVEPLGRSRDMQDTSVSSDDSKRSRKTKRVTNFFEADSMGSGGCQKVGMYVSFDDLGWKEWVIAPEGYEAGFCNGVCSFPLHNRMNATNHAIVQTLAHQVDPQSAYTARCAPVSLQSMKILFIDNHKNVVMKRYHDMVVGECGCH